MRLHHRLKLRHGAARDAEGARGGLLSHLGPPVLDDSPGSRAQVCVWVLCQAHDAPKHWTAEEHL